VNRPKGGCLVSPDSNGPGELETVDSNDVALAQRGPAFGPG
jgi:hypothetical protein